MGLNILKSNLFNPGTKFVATDDVKDTTLPPGSLGLFSFFKKADRDYQNVAIGTVVIIRRGKGGQNRIEVKDISFPIFTDKRMLEHEEYLPIGRKLYIHIEEEPFAKNNLAELPPLEFLVWCYAYTKYLRYIVGNFVYPASRASWKESAVGRALITAERIPEYFADNMSNTYKTLANTDFRTSFVVSARRLESKLAKCICSYKKATIASILNSSHFIEHTNKNHYIVADKNLVENTISFYGEEYEKISSLVERNKAAMRKKGA